MLIHMQLVAWLNISEVTSQLNPSISLIYILSLSIIILPILLKSAFTI